MKRRACGLTPAPHSLRQKPTIASAPEGARTKAAVLSKQPRSTRANENLFDNHNKNNNNNNYNINKTRKRFGLKCVDIKI